MTASQKCVAYEHDAGSDYVCQRNIIVKIILGMGRKQLMNECSNNSSVCFSALPQTFFFFFKTTDRSFVIQQRLLHFWSFFFFIYLFSGRISHPICFLGCCYKVLSDNYEGLFNPAAHTNLLIFRKLLHESHLMLCLQINKVQWKCSLRYSSNAVFILRQQTTGKMLWCALSLFFSLYC